MKKILCCIIIILFLNGCTVSNTTTFSVSPFRAEVTVKELPELRGKLDFKSAAEISFTILEPKDLNGIIFEIRNGNSYFCIDDVTFDINEAILNNGNKNVFLNLFEVLGALSSDAVQINKNNDKYSSSCIYGNFTCLFESDLKSIKEITSDNFTYNLYY